MDAERMEAIRAQAGGIIRWSEEIKRHGMILVIDEHDGAIEETSDPLLLARWTMDLIAEVERLTAENLRLTSELNLACGRFEAAVMAARWERTTTGEGL